MTITTEERLQIINLNLRRELLRRDQAAIDAEDARLTAVISERLKVDVSQYVINLDTGEVTPRLRTAPPQQPDDCLVYGATRDAANNAVDGTAIDFFAAIPQGVGDDVLTAAKVSVVSGPSTTHPTWTSGYFEASLCKTAKVRLASADTRLNGLQITIPSTSTAKLSSLVEAVV